MTVSWLPDVGRENPYGIHNLPYGAGIIGAARAARVVVRVGDGALDLASVVEALRPDLLEFVAGPRLNPLLAAGRAVWDALRASTTDWLVNEIYRAAVEPHLYDLDEIALVLPFEVADYVDFYASEHHASNLGRLLRPGTPPLGANWKHLPVGYHGRAGTVVVSGTPITRPSGQYRGADGPQFGPTARLDIEAEVGFVIGAPTGLGRPVALADARDHIFGLCVVNDWSARDVQAWEYVPLGPFLGKSFATSISPWIVPLAALEQARVAPPPRDEPLLPYLDDAAIEPWGFDIELSVKINGSTISTPPFASTYWTAAQMLAHMTVNGASIRAGDLFASGTVSGPDAGQQGSLMELSQGGNSPIPLRDGATRTFLLDGDEVVISALVPALGSRPEVGLGEVSGRIS